jgi:hypothetical protein
MKNIYAIFILSLLSYSVHAQCPTQQQITHSATQNIVGLNSVSCNAGGLHTDNGYFRQYDLNAFGILQDFEVSSVDVGIENATGAIGSQPAVLNLYTLSGPMILANLTPIHSEMVTVADQALAILNIPLTAPVVVPAGSILVVELFTPEGQTDGNIFFIGSNPDGQTSTSYIVAADCGVPDITDVAALGFPDMHIVMNVNGCEIIPPPIPTMGQWGIIILGLSLLSLGLLTMRSRKRSLSY